MATRPRLATESFVCSKACNESWEAQLTRLDSWALTRYPELHKPLDGVGGHLGNLSRPARILA